MNFRRYLWFGLRCSYLDRMPIVSRATRYLESIRSDVSFPHTFGFKIEHDTCANVRSCFTVPKAEITASLLTCRFSGQRSASRCRAGQNIFVCVFHALQSLRPGPQLNPLKAVRIRSLGAETGLRREAVSHG
jgi:hypothetical protein